MAVATLGLTYDDIRQRVGQLRGYGLDINQYPTDAMQMVEICLKNGSSKFYTGAAYEWSFLKPIADMVIPSGSIEILLPSDFGYLVGKIYFDPYASWRMPMEVEGEGKVLLQRQLGPVTTGRPLVAAIIPS